MYKHRNPALACLFVIYCGKLFFPCICFPKFPNKCAGRLIFLLREQMNVVECRLGFAFEACISYPSSEFQ